MTAQAGTAITNPTVMPKSMNTIRYFRSLAISAGGLLVGALAQDAAPKPVLTSAEPTVFREVAAKLDAGGSLYAYLSTDQFLGNLGAKVGAVRQFILSLPDMDADERSGMEQVFTGIQNLVQRSGAEGIAGVGLSGIALEKGFYRTRFVTQRVPGSEGYLWQWFGSKPHPLAGLDLLPADTVWAVFGDVDLKSIWDALLKNANDASLTPMIEGMRELSSNIQQATGRSLEDQLGSLGGEIGVALTLDSTRKFNFQEGGIELKDLPEPALVIVLKIKDDALYEWLDAAISQNPQSASGKTETARWRSLSVPVPVPFAVRPTVARLGDYLIVASNDQLIERVDKVRGGKEPGIKGSAEWQRLAKGLPTEGNSFTFVSARFGEIITQVQQAVLKQAAQGGGAIPDFAGLQKVFGLSTTAASYAVGWTDATGSQAVSQGTQEPAAVLVSSVIAAPTAIMAGMLLPALNQAKGKAQEVSCMNNLKQIALGMVMYANDHEDALPGDFQSIKEYLGGSPQVFVCPADSSLAGKSPSLTWDDVAKGETSYEFLKPGIKLDSANPMSTEIVRCRTHGTAAHLDGHVARTTR